MLKCVLIVSVLALIIFGFFIMDRLDNFMASPYFFPDTEEKGINRNKSRKVLIFGDHPVSTDIVRLLESRNMDITKIADFSEIDLSYSFEYLLAVSDSDLENLMVCTMCVKMMGIMDQFSICNSFENAKIYKDKHILYLYAESISAEEIVNMIFSSPRGDSYV